MPDAPISHIVGSGLGLVGGAIDEYLFVNTLVPPTASTIPRVRRSGNFVILESAAGKGDTVIGPATMQNGAQGSGSILIGNTVTASTAAAGAGSQVVGIGSNIAFGTGINNVVIGEQVAGVNFQGGGNVHIGTVASLGGSFRNDLITIGNITSATSSQSVLIGRGVSSTGNNQVVIGTNATASVGDSVVIGSGAGVSGNQSLVIGRAVTGTGTTSNYIAIGSSIGTANLSNIIALGHATSTAGLAPGDIVIGNNNSGGGGFSTRMVWGGANLHTLSTAVPAFTHRHKNAQGANIAAGNVTFIAPLGTGTGAPADIVFQTGDLAAAGSTLQTAVSRLTIRGDVGRVHFHPPTGATHGLHVDAAGGAGIPWIKVDNLTSGAGVAAGTLNNAPTAGDPSFWIPIQLDANVVYIPAWP